MLGHRVNYAVYTVKNFILKRCLILEGTSAENFKVVRSAAEENAREHEPDAVEVVGLLDELKEAGFVETMF